ncbi:hypothetical protein [Streptomyces sp. M41(2017)]|uniref:hypothetical protein n=1 Tax=Streptomyces sp. M41(2017) TaxID=1955065 RepID=UPI001180B3CA|nr:hypothetical protein [Streptomyces sp. M41(2017)]
MTAADKPSTSRSDAHGPASFLAAAATLAGIGDAFATLSADARCGRSRSRTDRQATPAGRATAGWSGNRAVELCGLAGRITALEYVAPEARSAQIALHDVLGAVDAAELSRPWLACDLSSTPARLSRSIP